MLDPGAPAPAFLTFVAIHCSESTNHGILISSVSSAKAATSREGLTTCQKSRAIAMHALILAIIVSAQLREKPVQLVVGKATLLQSFTCKLCGATISNFPAVSRADDLRPLEDNCRVHLQSSRWKMGQETGKLDNVQFAWIGLGAVVDIRTFTELGDPRLRNRTRWVQVFVLKQRIVRMFRDPRFPGILSHKEADGVLLGRFVWVESQFLKQASQNRPFVFKGDEVYFGETHFDRRKIQDLWGDFCERYSKIERKALRNSPRVFWQLVDRTLAESCDRFGISIQVTWTIFGCPTELGLKTFKPEHQVAIDKLRTLSYDKIHKP
jgi:hypothetical protein